MSDFILKRMALPGTAQVQSDAKRIIRGTATTSSVDRAGDIVDPRGAEFKLPLPLLWQH